MINANRIANISEVVAAIVAGKDFAVAKKIGKDTAHFGADCAEKAAQEVEQEEWSVTSQYSPEEIQDHGLYCYYSSYYPASGNAQDPTYGAILLNATPHAISITRKVTYDPSGILARVASISTMIDHPVGRVEVQQLGDITGLPAERIGVFYIVSAMVLAANKASTQPRNDLVAPATGHKDCVRNDKGLIVSVPHFVV